jgi:hypothetical protein
MRLVVPNILNDVRSSCPMYLYCEGKDSNFNMKRSVLPLS